MLQPAGERQTSILHCKFFISKRDGGRGGDERAAWVLALISEDLGLKSVVNGRKLMKK